MTSLSDLDLRGWIEPQGFATIPPDWHIVMTDVRHSTRAIGEGRYKEVNALGASCIIAVSNACSSETIPFVFGGDGATFVVPPPQLAPALGALRALRARASDSLGLELRVGHVEVSRVHADGFCVLHRQQPLESGFMLHLFSGGGLAHAEQLIKQAGPDPVDAERSGEEPDVEGLECRWNDVPATRGRMMTLIVKPVSGQLDALAPVLQVLRQIHTPARPVRTDNLMVSYPPQHLRTELRLRYRNRAARFLAETGLRLLLRLFKTVLEWKKDEPRNEVGRYFSSIGLNTDHLKLDDVFRAVLDVRDDEAARIESTLVALHRQGLVYYGVHYSEAALMTCFVRSRQRHIHFVDGSHGGYAVAAQQIKRQMGEAAACRPG